MFAGTWKDMYKGTTGTVALRLLEMLSPTSTVYFCRKFDLGVGWSLKPSWTLGWYVNSRLAIGL